MSKVALRIRTAKHRLPRLHTIQKRHLCCPRGYKNNSPETHHRSSMNRQIHFLVAQLPCKALEGCFGEEPDNAANVSRGAWQINACRVIWPSKHAQRRAQDGRQPCITTTHCCTQHACHHSCICLPACLPACLFHETHCSIKRLTCPYLCLYCWQVRL